MKAKLTDLLQRPGVRYLLVGGTVYVFELVIILLAQHAGRSAVFSVGLSYTLGTAVSFILQKLITFGDKRMHHKVLLPQLIATSLLVLFNFGFSLLVTQLLAGVVPAIVSRTVALGITVIWNFYLYKTKIFKPSEEITLG